MYITKIRFVIDVHCSLSPIQKQSIGELTGITFPLNLSFEYLPPALPPKRQLSGSKTSSLSGTPISSPKLPPAAMHYESVSDTVSLTATSSSSTSSTPQPQHQYQLQQIPPKSQPSPQPHQSAFDTPPSVIAPVPTTRPPTNHTSTATIATVAATTATRTSPVLSDERQTVTKVTNAHPTGDTISSTTTITTVVPEKSPRPSKVNNSNDTMPHRHRDDSHYIPLYNDYNNSKHNNDNNVESNIVYDKTTTTTNTNDKDVKQKTNDDGAKNHSNNEIGRNNCWDNNNEDVVLRNPSAMTQQQVNEVIVDYNICSHPSHTHEFY